MNLFRHERARAAGFTLVELLVVIAIIAILAGLILPLSGIAASKMRIARVKAELNNLVNAIETYKLELGEYPPDNGQLKLINVQAQPLAYKTNAALNPLFYELTGAIFTNGQFISIVENEVLLPADLTAHFKRSGIRNSARHKADLEYQGFNVKESQYTELASPEYGTHLDIFQVPVIGSFTLNGDKGKKINPWFYDASSTNRHNRNSFDLWAEITIGDQTNVIGNWKN